MKSAIQLAKISGVLEKRYSEKKGRDYYVVVLKLSENCNKEVFLEPAELELLLLQLDRNTQQDNQ